MPGVGGCRGVTAPQDFVHRAVVAVALIVQLPGEAPFAVDRNLRFHVAGCGSHTSKRMSESADGLLTPCTRQNGGRFRAAAVSEMGSSPDVTSVAEAMVVPWSKVRPVSAAHAAACPEAGAPGGGSCPATATTAADAVSNPATARPNNVRVSFLLLGLDGVGPSRWILRRS